MITGNPFTSFLMGGFECSTHRRGDDRRVDVIAASRHDRFAAADYARLVEHGLTTMRDGARWHLIEKNPYEYDFSSVLNQLEAAKKTQAQIIWDLFHYGFPDDLDLMSEEFITRFAAFAKAFTELLLIKGFSTPHLCLVNEISFYAWIAGEVGGWYPFLKYQGDNVKRQLVRASIAAAQAIKSVAPQAVLMQTDPLVNVVPSGRKPENIVHARNFHNAQFFALDVLLGKREPEIGGFFELIDIIGVNYYSMNQWRHPSRRRLRPGARDYKPFSRLLIEFYERYEKPLFVAETGIEDDARPAWFAHICAEVSEARRAGVPVWGICLYPIINHPGWDDNRRCCNGLWDYADASGARPIYEPLAEEVRKHGAMFSGISLESISASS